MTSNLRRKIGPRHTIARTQAQRILKAMTGFARFITLAIGSSFLIESALADELTRMNVSDDEIVNLLIRGSVKGNITNIELVRVDGPGVLLNVTFEGFEQHEKLHFSGDLKGGDRSVARVKAEEHTLGGPSGTIPVVLKFDLDDGQTVDVDALVVHVTKNNRPRLQYTYAFDQSMTGGAGSGGVVGVVKIRPVRLNSTPTVFAFNANYQLQKVAQPAAQPSPPQPNVIRAAQNSKLCFHKQSNNWNNGNRVHLWNCSAGQAGWKQWIYETDTGYIRSSGNRNMCIQKQSAGWANGNRLVLWRCNSRADEYKRWTYDSNTKQLKLRANPNKCVHKRLNNWNNGNILHLWDCAAGGNQMKTWNVVVPQVFAQFEMFEMVIAQPEADKTVKGPSATKVELISDVVDDAISRHEVLGLAIFEDKNPDSGVYYYHPNYYSLDWSPGADKPYGMYTTYRASDGSEPVGMGMRFRASQSTSQRRLIESLLKVRDPDFTELRELSGEYVVQMNSNLVNLFNIPADNIAAQNPALGQVSVEWVTDPIGNENIKTALAGQLGLNGTIQLQAADLPTKNIPMYANLASSEVFGKIDWDRNAGWKNETYHPIKFQRMHAIKIDKSVRLDSWDLNNEVVPPDAQVQWVAEDVPNNMQGSYDYIWIEYSVDECDSCDTLAASSIVGETGGVTVNLKLNILGPLGSCDLVAGLIKVRSRSLIAGGGQRTVEEIDIQDNQSYELTLHAETIDAARAEYQFVGVRLTGQPVNSTQWLPVENQNLYIGPHQVSELLGDPAVCQ